MKIIRNTLTINLECLQEMMKIVGYGIGWHFYPLHEVNGGYLFSGDICWVRGRTFIETMKKFGIRWEILFIDEERRDGGNIYGYRFNGGSDPERLGGNYNIYKINKKKKNFIKDRLAAI